MNRVLIMSSWTSVGHVGLSAATPVLQALGHHVTQLPTIILSNHRGWRHVAGRPIPAREILEMVAAIENADDITLEEYSEIGNAAQEDPALAKRLTAMFRAELGLPEEGAEDQS